MISDFFFLFSYSSKSFFFLVPRIKLSKKTQFKLSFFYSVLYVEREKKKDLELYENKKKKSGIISPKWAFVEKKGSVSFLSFF